MNKNKYILLGAVVLGLGLTSCSDFLNVDRYFRDQQSTERIFSDKDYTLQWLSFCYSRLQGDNLEVGHMTYALSISQTTKYSTNEEIVLLNSSAANI